MEAAVLHFVPLHIDTIVAATGAEFALEFISEQFDARNLRSTAAFH